jgi:hypothetical protein
MNLQRGKVANNKEGQNRPLVLGTLIYEGLRLEQEERLVRNCPKYT